MDKTLLVLITLHLVPPALLLLRLQDTTLQFSILLNIILSAGGFLIAHRIIPSIAAMNAKAGLSGKDLNKKDGKQIPEALGLATGTVWLVCVILFQVVQWYEYSSPASLAEYNAALTSVCFALLLGFADDVLNLRWRYKLVLPLIASLPLIVAYAGVTTVVVPIPLRFALGKILELGILYRIYLSMLAIFCTNSINILAGINGLEAGQSFVISCAVITHNLIELTIHKETAIATHTLSLYLMLPFLASTLALWCYNWFPSRVFVGDTFTYFSGMCFAVVAILCHFSKTLMLFFIPQILNFLYSLPQLFHLVPCPRHRIPKYNDADGKMHATPNYTIINLLLNVFGPMSEKKLCVCLILFQDVCCVIGFAIRYYVSLYFFDE